MLAPNESPEQPADGWDGAELPKRNPGTSPMAAAGARAGETRALAGGSPGDRTPNRAGETTERHGAAPARRSPRVVDIAAAAALLAVGGTALVFSVQHAGHEGRADASSSAAPPQSRAASAPPASPVSSASSAASAASATPAASATSATPAASAASATPAALASAVPVRQAPPIAPVAPRRTAPVTSPQIVGVGCPGSAGAVTVNDAQKGPGWRPAGGGWTGNGCDGSTVWTMDPNGKQPRRPRP
jgi:hypothetical protein